MADKVEAAEAEEEVGWDDDSEDEAGEASEAGKAQEGSGQKAASGASSTTIQPKTDGLLRPSESPKSNDEKSQADSEASYDVVGAASGVTSHAPNSPNRTSKKDDDSDDDWE